MRGNRQRSVLIRPANHKLTIAAAVQYATDNKNSVATFINKSGVAITSVYWNKTLSRVARATPIDFTAWADSDEPLSAWFDSYGAGSASLDATNGIVFSGVYFLRDKEGSPRKAGRMSNIAIISNAPSLTADESMYGLGHTLGLGVSTDYIHGEGVVLGTPGLVRLTANPVDTSGSLSLIRSATLSDRSQISQSEISNGNATYEAKGSASFSFGRAATRNGILTFNINVFDLEDAYHTIIGQRPTGADVATMDFSVSSLD